MACDQPEQVDQADLDRLLTTRCPARMPLAGFIFPILEGERGCFGRKAREHARYTGLDAAFRARREFDLVDPDQIVLARPPLELGAERGTDGAISSLKMKNRHFQFLEGSLRRRKLYKAMRDATLTVALREWFRIVHISLQRNHVHLLIEADDKTAPSRGMQGFLISAARHINTALGDGARRRRGKVFADRYHVEVITTPTRAHHTISYLLSNWRKHGEDRAGLPSTWLVDPFSSGISFPDWAELEGKAWMWPIRETYDPLMVRRPQTWLLREGWKLGGGAISARDVPGRQR